MMMMMVCVDSNSSSPTMTHVIPKGKGVGGVASLGDDVFVVRCDSQQKIEVYDTKTFTLQRHVTVPGLADCVCGLAACPHSNCLYASDSESVHRVGLSVSNEVMKWSVARGPAGLSVNSEHNLLVVSYSESCRYSRLMELCYRTFNCRLILEILGMPCSCLPVNFWLVIPAHYIASV